MLFFYLILIECLHIYYVDRPNDYPNTFNERNGEMAFDKPKKWHHSYEWYEFNFKKSANDKLFLSIPFLLICYVTQQKFKLAFF